MNLPQPWRRISAIALLLAVVSAGVLLIGAPLVRAHMAASGDIAHTRTLLGRYDALLRAEPELASQLKELRAAGAGSVLYWEGATEALASATLQRHVKRALEAAGGKVRRIQTLAADQDGGFQRIGLRVTMDCTNASLFEALYTLESGEPYLFVDRLTARAGRKKARKTDPASQSSLQVSFDVRGYLDPGANQ